MIVKASNFADIFNSRSYDAFSGAQGVTSNITYHDGTGYHIYTQLSLTNTLANPTTTKLAESLFEIIQRYTDLADCCLKNTPGKILEVQGERLHLYYPGELNSQTAKEVTTVCAALTNAVYEKKYRLGNTNFKGFKICLDYGRAVILRTGNDADDSLISLGPCANAPAKHLPEVTAEHTAFATEIAKCIFKDVDARYSWYEKDLRDKEKLQNIVEQQRLDSILSSASSFNPVYQAGRFTVRAGTSFVPGNNSLPNAMLVQGLFLRADLDGFTSRVKKGFDDGNIDKLVEDFCRVVMYGDNFINKAKRPVIRIPWAGDCANLVAMPKTNSESIKDLKYYYPATGAYDWLSRYDGELVEPYPGAAWLVSICAGNAQILVAPVETNGRKFLFAAGWGVGRSLDAQEQDGLKPNESVISKEDYDDLEVEYKKQYSMLNTVFAHSAPLSTIRESSKTVTPSLIGKSHTVSEKIANAVPSPRPHWR